ncbi:MAG: glutathione S-transferase family protein [Rubellimicrobium sp.]|nr:glutathione S-transferase family protein [Rubellimicrobium sp.]
MTLTLYSNPMSRGRIARWMLEETGQPHEVVHLDYGPPMQAPAYLAINPMGKVPALVHDGRVVTEYAAICAYLADTFPEAGLKPTDTSAYWRWLFFGAGPLEGAVVLKALGHEVPADKRGFVGFRDIGTMAGVLVDWLERNEWLAGDSFSAADVATGSQIRYGHQFGTLPHHPVLDAYVARLNARPAWIRANAADDAALAATRAGGAAAGGAKAGSDG